MGLFITYGVILELFWSYSGVILGLFWGYLLHYCVVNCGVHMGLFWSYSGVILGLFWGYCGVIVGLLGGYCWGFWWLAGQPATTQIVSRLFLDCCNVPTS